MRPRIRKKIPRGRIRCISIYDKASSDAIIQLLSNTGYQEVYGSGALWDVSSPSLETGVWYQEDGHIYGVWA